MIWIRDGFSLWHISYGHQGNNRRYQHNFITWHSLPSDCNMRVKWHAILTNTNWQETNKIKCLIVSCDQNLSTIKHVINIISQNNTISIKISAQILTFTINPNCLKQLSRQSMLHYEDNLRENATKSMFISSILSITYEFSTRSLNSGMKTKKLRGNVDDHFLLNCKFALLLDPSIDFV